MRQRNAGDQINLPRKHLPQIKISIDVSVGFRTDIKIVAAPGLWLQKITTKEPDDSQLEVSIVSLKAALGEENINNAKDITGEEKN